MASSSSCHLKMKREEHSPDEDDHHHYDVFISFRGKDTRNNFTSHVYDALCRKHIHAFIDNKELRTGHEVEGSLLKAIQVSKLYLVIFSPDYGSSSWCLMELEKILQYRRDHRKTVIPVFYKVDPSCIRYQNGSFKDAFVKHEKRQKEHEVQSWRSALQEAASLSGLHLSDERSETEFINEIVEVILKELYQRIPLTYSKNLVGNIDSYVYPTISSLLGMHMHSPQVHSVGIWGMGGIGKTTIAGVVFGYIHTHFDGSYFFENVRETLKGSNKSEFWSKVLSQILDEKNHHTLSLKLPFVKQRLRRKKAFIVFDDVDKSVFLELQDLVEHHDLFGAGSRILMTSRDKQVLHELRVDEIYEVEGLDYSESLKLLSRMAFKQESPPDAYMELSKKVVDYTQGNPLALKVLGSAFLGRSQQYWESALDEIHKFPKKEILDLLRISYDGLSWEERNVFLDVACFFKGEEEDHVMGLLECFYGTCVYSIISHLVDKSLISISLEKKLQVHDLVQEMGWRITDEAFIDNPGKRSRLHDVEEICQVLMEKKGTEAIHGIILNLPEARTMSFEVDAFLEMVNLRWLKIYGWNHNVCHLKSMEMGKFWWHKIFGENRVFLPHLRYLFWEAFPLKSLSSAFHAPDLVKLSLPNSKIERLWTGVQDVVNLRWMDLSECHYLTEIPDMSKAKNVEVMDLGFCRSLIRLHPSVQYLNKLQVLQLSRCYSLREIPSRFESKVLRVFSLHRCTEIKECPVILSNKLEKLHLGGTEIKEFPNSIISSQFLGVLRLESCRDMTKFSKFPSSLEVLWVKECGIKKVSSSLQLLTKLLYLCLEDNQKLRRITRSISTLKCLTYLELQNCSLLTHIPELPLSTQTLKVENCRSLQTVSSISTESQLTFLSFENCSNLEVQSCENIIAYTIFRTQILGKKITSVVPLTGVSERFPDESTSYWVTIQWPSGLHNNNSLKGIAFWAALKLNPPEDEDGSSSLEMDEDDDDGLTVPLRINTEYLHDPSVSNHLVLEFLHYIPYISITVVAGGSGKPSVGHIEESHVRASEVRHMCD